MRRRGGGGRGGGGGGTRSLISVGLCSYIVTLVTIQALNHSLYLSLSLPVAPYALRLTLPRRLPPLEQALQEDEVKRLRRESFHKVSLSASFNLLRWFSLSDDSSRGWCPIFVKIEGVGKRTEKLGDSNVHCCRVNHVGRATWLNGRVFN